MAGSAGSWTDRLPVHQASLDRGFVRHPSLASFGASIATEKNSSDVSLSRASGPRHRRMVPRAKFGDRDRDSFGTIVIGACSDRGIPRKSPGDSIHPHLQTNHSAINSYLRKPPCWLRMTHSFVLYRPYSYC